MYVGWGCENKIFISVHVIIAVPVVDAPVCAALGGGLKENLLNGLCSLIYSAA